MSESSRLLADYQPGHCLYELSFQSNSPTLLLRINFDYIREFEKIPLPNGYVPDYLAGLFEPSLLNNFGYSHCCKDTSFRDSMLQLEFPIHADTIGPLSHTLKTLFHYFLYIQHILKPASKFHKNNKGQKLVLEAAMGEKCFFLGHAAAEFINNILEGNLSKTKKTVESAMLKTHLQIEETADLKKPKSNDEKKHFNCLLLPERKIICLKTKGFRPTSLYINPYGEITTAEIENSPQRHIELLAGLAALCDCYESQKN